MKISILTATYNRAKLLPRLYESILKNYNNHKDIEWLIMDDGSNDNTEEVINSWINNSKFKISYYKCKNGGKMNAINKLMVHATGDIIIEMDSDDYFCDNVFKMINNDFNKHKDEDIYGICYQKELIGKKYDEVNLLDGKIEKLYNIHYKYDLNYDMAIVFKSDVRKKFIYELVDDERFITEADMYYKMDDMTGGLLIKNKKIMICEYQEDGYSKNILKIFKNYPKGYYKFFSYLVNHENSQFKLNKKLYFIKHYILFSVLNNVKFNDALKEIDRLKEKLLFTILYIPGKLKTKKTFSNKKLLFTAYSLGLGGIETALVSLLNNIDLEAYDVTLVLEKKEGKFLNDINTNVKVLEYRISDSKNVLYRKIYNRLKLIKWGLFNYRKYDFSASFATYSIPGGLLALIGSKNNAIWVHNNYYRLLDNKASKMIKYFKELKFHKFKRIVFVSNDNRDIVLKYCPYYRNKSIVCNNFINGKKVLNGSKEEVVRPNKTTFINVGRHEEKQKRIMRILEATLKLKDEYDFEVWLIGDGPDSDMYKDFVKKHSLSDYIKFYGFQKNPYGYMKSADALLLSSEYEGYPVVFIEAMILDLPIVSTKVSDYEPLEDNYGIFVDTDVTGVYHGMKTFMDKPFKIKNKFDYKEYNEKIIKILNSMFNGVGE